MNIKVITRHAPSNYGSLLQAIATQNILEKLGHHCEILDYRRDDEKGLKGVCAFMERKRKWKSSVWKQMVYIGLKYPCECIAEYKFSKMRRQYLKLTKHYKTIDELSDETNADKYMTGSDQVWGPVANKSFDPAYFLSFIKDNSKKIAYAASFGRADFSEDILDLYEQMLSQYKYITVRENRACDLLKRMHVACQGQVLDPTLLLTKEEWLQFIDKEVKLKNYVLVYQIHNNPILDDYAQRFAKAKGLPLIRISSELYQLFRGGKFKLLPDLGLFLSYIKEATYIVTDSFHGTAFSIAFNKQFIEILSDLKTGSRNQSILQLTGLQNRIVKNYNDFSISEEKIQYDLINDILQKERDKSIALLRQIIEN